MPSPRREKSRGKISRKIFSQWENVSVSNVVRMSATKCIVHMSRPEGRRKIAAGKKRAFNGRRNLSRRQNTGPECVLSVRWIILLPLQLLPFVPSHREADERRWFANKKSSKFISDPNERKPRNRGDWTGVNLNEFNFRLRTVTKKFTLCHYFSRASAVDQFKFQINDSLFLTFLKFLLMEHIAWIADQDIANQQIHEYFP